MEMDRGRVGGDSSQEKIHWPQETENSMYFQKMGTGQTRDNEPSHKVIWELSRDHLCGNIMITGGLVGAGSVG